MPVAAQGKTIVVTPEKAKFYWDEYNFKDYNCIFDRQNCQCDVRLSQTRRADERIKHRRYRPKDPEKDLLVTKSVYLNQADAQKLKEMNEAYGVESIYFQATPSAPKSTLKDVLKQFNL